MTFCLFYPSFKKKGRKEKNSQKRISRNNSFRIESYTSLSCFKTPKFYYFLDNFRFFVIKCNSEFSLLDENWFTFLSKCNEFLNTQYQIQKQNWYVEYKSICLRIFYAQMSTNSEDAFELGYLVNAVHHRCISGNTYKTNAMILHAQMYWKR